jgi:hypothetical protein
MFSRVSPIPTLRQLKDLHENVRTLCHQRLSQQTTYHEIKMADALACDLEAAFPETTSFI